MNIPSPLSDLPETEKPQICGQGGFTLVEVVVASAVFIVVLLITGASFETIVRNSVKLVKSEESNIEGLVGLELLRHDLEQAGFGLFWGYVGTPPDYTETTSSPGVLFNEASGAVPHAISGGDNLTAKGTPAVPEKELVQGSDYLVVRGTTVGTTKTARRWTYVNYSSKGKTPRVWPTGNIGSGEGTIVLRRRFSNGGGNTNDLVHDAANKGGFTFLFNNGSFLIPEDAASGKIDTFFIYGVDDGKVLRMPFNRTDFYVKRTDTTPSGCAPHTGTLQKGVVAHSNGALSSFPLLDCVADMQVVLGWDMDGDGKAEVFSNADGSVANGGDMSEVQAALHDPAALRERLKLVKVYLLAQNGVKDPAYTADQQEYLVGDEGEESLTRKIDLAKQIGPEWSHYRWKLYRVVVNPKNLSGKWH